MANRLEVACLNETFLNQAVEHIALEGYSLVTRRDRSDGRSGGGVVVFAIDSIAERVALIATSDSAEKCWLLVQLKGHHPRQDRCS